MSVSIKRNLSLQTIYQILNTCLPLITAPYLTRVLGVTQLGVFSFTSSVVAYFTLVAMLGTVNYGTRSIASVGNNKETRSRIFWGIYWLQFLMSFVALLSYSLYLLFFCQENKIVALIQLISIISCFFDINWLFFGVESYTITVSRSIFIKILTVGAIFVFVKKPEDLWLYTVFMLGGTFISQAILWLYAHRYIFFTRVSFHEILNHLKPNLILFIPLVAMSVYHTMDKTMLGILSNYEECGYYYNADKVINIPLCVLNGVGTVMLPRMTALYHDGKQAEGDQLFKLSIEGIAAVSCAMLFGISGIAKEFIPFFFGKGYERCILLTISLSPVLLIKGFSNAARTQYLVPLKMESVFTKSVLAGAVTNLIFNLLLIPKMGALGAVIGTLLAEIVSCIWQFIFMQKSINLIPCLKSSLAYIAFGILMFAFVRIVALLPVTMIFKLILEVLIGGAVFIAVCILYWKKTKNVMFKAVFGNLISKIPLLRKIL